MLKQKLCVYSYRLVSGNGLLITTANVNEYLIRNIKHNTSVKSETPDTQGTTVDCYLPDDENNKCTNIDTYHITGLDNTASQSTPDLSNELIQVIRFNRSPQLVPAVTAYVDPADLQSGTDKLGP